VALVLNPRIEVTVALLVLYLGLLDGPIKLGLGSGGPNEAVAVVPDVLLLAVALGAILRIMVKRDAVKLPALSVWVFAFVALVLIEAFNPKTAGILKVLGGYRQQLQWVPFFFFGYAIMRSRERFRKLFLVLGVITLANGVVATYQTQITPAQLASWGPGYKTRVRGLEEEAAEGAATKRRGARVFVSEGQARVRPMALGSDFGRGGGLGVITLPGVLALLAIASVRRRWVGILLCLGALLAIGTSLARAHVVGAVLAVLAFVALSTVAARRVSRAIAALLAVVGLAVPLGIVFVSATGSGAFSRYASLAHTDPTSNCNDCKRGTLKHIPHQIAVAPFGIGLGTVAGAGFGGHVNLEEVQKISAETEYSYLTDELGAPGLILWTAFVLTLIGLPVFRMRRIDDPEVRLWLAALAAPLVAMLVVGTSAVVSTSTALGPFLWFVAGTYAYWFAGSGPAHPARMGRDPAPMPAVAGA